MGRAKAQGGLGFRDLVCFNKTLLAKPYWRRMQYPNRLAAKIILAKNYPHGTLRTAQLGNMPSFAWRSIMAGRDLFEAVIFWRIGNCRYVRIRCDKWIPQPITFAPQATCSTLPADAKVEALIEGNPIQWKRELIQTSFNAEKVELICNIPLSRYDQDDKMIWQAISNG